MSSNNSKMTWAFLEQAARRLTSRVAVWTICLIAAGATPGCHLFQKPGVGTLAAESTPLRGSDSAEVFQRIREAKSQNAIVMQIAGDSSPIRVLPLPPDGQSVFISDLLKQTGIQDKLGRIHATLYRPTPDDPSGIRMEVKFSERSGIIRPETDYALQAGDRIRISKNEQSSFAGMFDQILPSNGARAFRGY
jgi:hypothetical protein